MKNFAMFVINHVKHAVPTQTTKRSSHWQIKF